MTKSVCGGVRSSTLDSLGTRYHKKRKIKIFTKKRFFLEKKTDDIFQKNENFQKVTFFEEVNFRGKSLFRKKWLFEIFHFLKKCHRIFFKKKNVFFQKFFIFLFLWCLISKMSNVELLTPPHTLLVTVYVSGIFFKIRKIQKILQTVLIRIIFPLIFLH